MKGFLIRQMAWPIDRRRHVHIDGFSDPQKAFPVECKIIFYSISSSGRCIFGSSKGPEKRKFCNNYHIIGSLCLPSFQLGVPRSTLYFILKFSPETIKKPLNSTMFLFVLNKNFILSSFPFT